MLGISRRTAKTRRLRPIRKPINRNRLRIEELETRTLLSASAGFATPFYHVLPNNLTNFNPTQFRHAYGMDTITGDGTGQTIAIVDAYNEPNIVADLAHFDTTYGLPAPPSFKIINQFGGTRLPRGNHSWSLEIALDVEWAHAMAPGANILLVEAFSNSFSNLFKAAKTAAKQPGVSAVSMSFGGSEFSGETSNDATFTTPAGHQGVTFFASTGDSGSGAQYPSASPNLVAVGGTRLNADNSGNYLSETGWSGSGGGPSAFEAEPPYQLGVQNSGKREAPDISLDADPATGALVYDSYDGGTFVVGGTSLSSPAMAGIIAVANQGRVAAGKNTLDGAQKVIYTLPAADFHDITAGSNGGFTAGPGYDQVTGIGTPKAPQFIADLISLVPSNAIVGHGPANSGTSSGNQGFANPSAVQALIQARNVGFTTSSFITTSPTRTFATSSPVPNSILNSAPINSASSAFATRTNIASPVMYVSPARASAGIGDLGSSLGDIKSDDMPRDLLLPGLPTITDGDGEFSSAASAVAPYAGLMAGEARDVVFTQDESVSDSRTSVAVNSENGVETVNPAVLAGLAMLAGSSWGIHSDRTESAKKRRFQI